MTEASKASTHLLRLVAIGLVASLVAMWMPAWSPSRTIGWAVYRDDTLMPRVIRSFLVFGVVSLFTTIWALIRIRDKRLHAWLWLLWAVVPPLWFLAEYFVLFPFLGKPDAEAFNMFRYGQESAAKLWAAGVAICTGALLKDLKLFGHEEGVPPGGEAKR